MVSERIINFQAGIMAFLLALSLILQGITDDVVVTISVSLILLSSIQFFYVLRKQKQFELTAINISLALWLIWIALPTYLGIVSNSAMFGFFQCSLWVFAFFMFDFNKNPQRLFHIVVVMLGLLGFTSALYGLWQFIVLNEMPSGFFAGKNTHAAFLMSTLFILIGEFILCLNNSKIEKWCQFILGVLIFFEASAMFAVLSRGVFLSFLIFFIVLCILLREQLSKQKLIPLLTLLGMALLSIMMTGQAAIEHRLELLHDEQSRLVIWQGAWHLLQNIPWYGVGIFNFMHFYPAFSRPYDASTLQYAHNDYLQLLIETGIPGALIIILLMGAFMVISWRYLKQKPIEFKQYVRSCSVFCALGSLVCHSVIDFNFYILFMNLLIGCYLGYLHSIYKMAGTVPVRMISLTDKKSRGLGMLLFVCLMVISYTSLRLFMVNHYLSQSEQAMQKQDLSTALIDAKKAKKWFTYPELQSHLGELYMQLANDEPSITKQRKLAAKAENLFKAAQKGNPYFARPYFQLGLLHLLFLDDVTQAKRLFQQALHYDPHFCLARVTYARVLIENKQWLKAQKTLEAGLYYPIPKEYAETYLNYLAKLRYENGFKTSALRVANRLQHLNVYKQDYSDLL